MTRFRKITRPFILFLFSAVFLFEFSACGGNGNNDRNLTEKTIDIQPELVELPERHYLVFRQALPLADMDGFFGIESPILLEKAIAAGIAPTGPITALFYEWNTDLGKGDAAVALPVELGAQLQGYVPITLPRQRAFVADWKGPYTGLGAVHYALAAQYKLNDLVPAVPSIEEYLSGPVDGVSEENFHTRIIYPIAE